MKVKIFKIFDYFGIPFNISPIAIGYLISTLISFSATPYLFEKSQQNSLELITLNIFLFLGLFDLGLGRMILYIFSKIKNPIPTGIKIFIYSLILFPLISIFAFKLLLLDNYSNYSLYKFIHLSIVISLCSLFNLYKYVTDSIGILKVSAIYRPIQILLIIFNLIYLYDKPFPGILITSIISLYFGYFTLRTYKEISLKNNYHLVLERSNKKVSKLDILQVYINLLLASIFISGINLGERFIIPWLATSIITSSYYAFQIYFSKLISLGTLICTSYYPIFVKNILEKSILDIKNSLIKSCSSAILISSLASVLIYLIIYLYANKLFEIFGFFPIIICLIGGILNVINCQLFTFLEASENYKYKTIIFVFSTITSVLILLYCTTIFSVGTSFMSYWFIRGLIEFLILFYFIKKIFYKLKFN